MNLDKFIALEFSNVGHLMLHMAAESTEQIAVVGKLMADCIRSTGKILIFGNCGSAADAEHFAAELVGKYRQERNPLPALALTTNAAQITSISNDLGYELLFSRQVQAFAKPGDVVVGISTSGRSVNVITGLQTAHDCGASTVAMIGSDIIGLAAVADHVISVPSNDTPRIQEAHAVIIHILCDIVEQSLPDVKSGRINQ